MIMVKEDVLKGVLQSPRNGVRLRIMALTCFRGDDKVRDWENEEGVKIPGRRGYIAS